MATDVRVALIGDDDSLRAALNRSSRAVTQFGQKSDRAARQSSQSFSRLGGATRTLRGQVAGLIAGAGLGQFFHGAIMEANEAQTAMAQTEATIRSTGGTAGITAEHLANLADRLSDVAAVDDELVQSGGNVLLTFKNIKAAGGIFDDALAGATDLAQNPIFGGDIVAAARMLGRALNDPAKGLSRLARAGVDFSAEQQRMIQQMAAFGNTAGAQRIILRELESQIGGSAAANATASARMTVAWENIKETVGTALLPVVSALADLAERFAELPAPIQQATVALLAFVAASAAFESLGLASAIAGVGSALSSGLLSVLAAIVSPIGIVIAGLLTTAATMFLIWQHTQPLRDLYRAIWNVVQQIAGISWDGFMSAIASIVEAFRIWWQVSAPVRGILNVIGSIAFVVLRQALANAVQWLRTMWQITQPVRSILSAIGGLGWGVLRAAVSAVANHIRAVWTASQPIRAVLAQIGGMALSALRSAVQSIASAFSRIGSILDSIASKIRNLPSPHIEIPHIPGFASGVFSAPGGLALVGEHGPEFVNLRRGARVYDAHESSRMGGGGSAGSGGNSYTFNFHGTVGDRRAIQRWVVDAVRQAEREQG